MVPKPPWGSERPVAWAGVRASEALAAAARGVGPCLRASASPLRHPRRAQRSFLEISSSCDAGSSAAILRSVYAAPFPAKWSCLSDRAAMRLKKSPPRFFFSFPLGKLFNRPRSLAEVTLHPYAGERAEGGEGKQRQHEPSAGAGGAAATCFSGQGGIPPAPLWLPAPCW